MDIDWIAFKLDSIELHWRWIGLDWRCHIFVVFRWGYSNSRSVKNWIGLHCVGCVAFHICVALNDWIVWVEWISIRLHWIWIALDWKLHIGLEVSYFLLDCIGLGYFNFRSVKNWIGLHWVSCVAFRICVALNDWVVWIEWLTIRLH